MSSITNMSGFGGYYDILTQSLMAQRKDYMKADADKNKVSENSDDFISKVKGEYKAGAGKVCEKRIDLVDSKDSVVAKRNEKHPETKDIINGRLKRGKEIQKKAGLSDEERMSMSGDEYKQYFWKVMNSIPRDSSQMRDKYCYNISDKGWEQLQKDPDYEAFIFGYRLDDSAVRMPFAGYKGSYNVEIYNIGESLDDFSATGQTVFPNGTDDDDGFGLGDWWIKRHERFEENIKLGNEKSLKMKQFQGKQMQQFYLSRMMNQNMYGDLSGMPGLSGMLEYAVDSRNGKLLSAVLSSQGTASLASMI